MTALTEGLQDYLEAILLCERKHRFVRTKHLAERLGVKSPSVHAAVKELTHLGLVEHESYGHIELTPEGRKEAELVYSRHKTLYRFFTDILDLPRDLAENNACGIEHHLDEITLKRLTRFLDFLERKMKQSDEFANELKETLNNE
ncbi:metal-dependent transcriptional regulator [candidate division WOR-3 bacterium]|nr:metal-dependent transcriptional regulator [candidate division WOR-3 bacterium]